MNPLVFRRNPVPKLSPPGDRQRERRLNRGRDLLVDGLALLALQALVWLPAIGCGTTGESFANRLVDGSLVPFASSGELDRDELREAVENDPFPAAQRVGVAVASDDED